ncbi:hypothetical protein PC129_g18814 [Phytophthora cactorum]|uniref:Uncharacterized protein n=1 Tax=Phytophthora cactorum TaxID=29920 RepID=A0A329S9H5_9STRA|nr:hypothetical protein Pcac1_g12381 [Phytophthora cactorum]KAG2801576.1 hypothetical protein PC112_g19979 [Phytophthora cactorum]KAG2838005.1 hypothetical protein PC111_g4429 [Phytophthora cactorum]KAG2839906.1 hypothetical protein PC113_g19375 [Phytophthora cactorum]KAG2883088.1 hypothetical protein PC114_g20735 [Phytophthora cactorum]
MSLARPPHVILRGNPRDVSDDSVTDIVSLDERLPSCAGPNRRTYQTDCQKWTLDRLKEELTGTNPGIDKRAPAGEARSKKNKSPQVSPHSHKATEKTPQPTLPTERQQHRPPPAKIDGAWETKVAE